MWLVLTIIAILVAFLYYYKTVLNYWNNVGVQQISIQDYLKDNVKLFFKRYSITESMETSYKMFPEARYTGLYQFSRPALMIRDPEVLKEVTIKSFDNFVNHSSFISEEVEPLWSRNLFALKDQKWRQMRIILSPSFTSSKMRILYGLISDCAQNFSKHFLNKNDDVFEVEFKDVFTRYTNDVIATSAFGIKTDSLENKTNEFYTMGKKLTNFAAGVVGTFKLFLMMMNPKLFAWLRISIFDREVTSFFIDLIDNTLKQRKEKGIVRPDMINLLMEAQKGTQSKEEAAEDSSFAAQEETYLGGNAEQKEQEEMTNMDITAQALIFFFAGFETVSVLMCFMAYELAVQPDIQTRLREEIEETLSDCQGKLTYEAVLKMKYMDMVVSESLRKWPSAELTDRQCTKPYTIQPKLPGEKPVHIKKDSLLLIPMYAIQRDPKYYPDPDKFDPERFSDENKGKIEPYAYLPFGLGPRSCIGSRFALLEIKTLFIYLLHNFELVPTAKSTIPLKLSTANFNLDAEGGFWFGLKRLENNIVWS